MAFLITIFELIKSLRKDTESWTSPSMDKLMAYLQSADGIRQVIAMLTANCFFQWRLEQAVKFRIVDNVVALSKVLHCTSRHFVRVLSAHGRAPFAVHAQALPLRLWLRRFSLWLLTLSKDWRRHEAKTMLMGTNPPATHSGPRPA